MLIQIEISHSRRSEGRNADSNASERPIGGAGQESRAGGLDASTTRIGWHRGSSDMLHRAWHNLLCNLHSYPDAILPTDTFWALRFGRSLIDSACRVSQLRATCGGERCVVVNRAAAEFQQTAGHRRRGHSAPHRRRRHAGPFYPHGPSAEPLLVDLRETVSSHHRRRDSWVDDSSVAVSSLQDYSPWSPYAEKS
jgi:hypothetical protein